MAEIDKAPTPKRPRANALESRRLGLIVPYRPLTPARRRHHHARRVSRAGEADGLFGPDDSVPGQIPTPNHRILVDYESIDHK